MMKALTLEEMEQIIGGAEENTLLGINIFRKAYLALITVICKARSFPIEYVLNNYCRNEEEREYVISIWNS